MRQILGIAVKEELIQKSPFFGGHVEFLHEKGRERTLSFDEERKYLKAAAPVLWDVAMIMVEMGLRPGEIFQLRSEEVRVEPPAPYVHIREGKSDRAIRDVRECFAMIRFVGTSIRTRACAGGSCRIAVVSRRDCGYPQVDRVAPPPK